MADNTVLNPGTSGDTIRDVARQGGTIKTQVVQLDLGGPAGNAENLITGAVPTIDVNTAAAGTSDAPLFVAITGDPTGDFAGVNILEQAATDNSGLALNVKLLNGPATDANNAAILSDAKPLQTPWLQVSGQFTFDTTGYQSFNITTQALAANVTTSDDGVTWSALSGAPKILGALVTAVAATTGYHFPVIARFVRLAATTAGTATIYLRSSPWAGAYTTTVPTATASNNVAQWAGTTLVNAGVAGIPAVGGNIAAGSAATANPVPIGGADIGGLTRRPMTDTNGNVQQVGPLPAGSQIGSYNNATFTQAQSTVNPVIMAGADQGSVVRRLLTDLNGSILVTESASTLATAGVTELLTQILAVQRVAALYLYQLVQSLTGSSDEPEALIADYLNPASDGAMPHLKN